MPENWKGEATDRLCDAFLTLKTREEVYAFLEDIATIGEFKGMAQRLELAVALDAGRSYPELVQQASTATISRVRRCLDYGAGGYKMVLERLKNTEAKTSK